MLNKGNITGDIRTRGNMEELLHTLFISLNMWEETLLNTEFNQDSAAIKDMIGDMVALEITIGAAGMTFPKLLKRMTFDLPAGVVAAKVENPLYESEAKDDQSKDQPSGAASWDDDNLTPEELE